jgi:predicted HAD superfamily phosphohydrolase YqeG
LNELSNEQILQMITQIIQKHGCQVIELDIENRIINFDGPNEAKIECATELEAILDMVG